jgi:hypothetical protein
MDDKAQDMRDCSAVGYSKRRLLVKERIYEGIRHPNETDSAGESFVLVNGQTLPLAPSLKLRNHSPAGFNWGYGGSGPAQLALAILFDYYEDKEKALRLHQAFKFRVVAAWPQENGWTITGAEIERVCAEIEAKQSNSL